jgi:ankyrin repeat protein
MNSKQLECPLSLLIMYDPVISIDDGFTYEKEYYYRHILLSNNSPMTNLPLTNTGYVSNILIKSCISDYIQLHPDCVTDMYIPILIDQLVTALEENVEKAKLYLDTCTGRMLNYDPKIRSHIKKYPQFFLDNDIIIYSESFIFENTLEYMIFESDDEIVILKMFTNFFEKYIDKPASNIRQLHINTIGRMFDKITLKHINIVDNIIQFCIKYETNMFEISTNAINNIINAKHSSIISLNELLLYRYPYVIDKSYLLKVLKTYPLDIIQLMELEHAYRYIYSNFKYIVNYLNTETFKFLINQLSSIDTTRNLIISNFNEMYFQITNPVIFGTIVEHLNIKHLKYKDMYGNNLLHLWIKYTDIAKMLFHKHVSINRSNNMHETPLMLASTFNPDILYYIVSQQPNVVFQTSTINNNLLMNACQYNEKLIPYFVDCKIDINAKNLIDDTALLIACAYSPNSVKYLLHNGADINASNKYGKKAMHVAILTQNESLIYTLIENKIRLFITDKISIFTKNIETGEMIETKYNYFQLLDVVPQLKSKVHKLFLKHITGAWNHDKKLIKSK